MLFANRSAAEKRAALRAGLESGKLLQAPGAYAPLVALEIEARGFEAVYVSGAVLAADLGLPDIGLTTLTEVARRAHQIARVTDLPAIVDLDTGFGEPMNAARSLRTMEEQGIAGCHIEDQVNPKRCGHLDNKAVVETAAMVRRVRAAAKAKRDPNFVLIARSDARAVEGLDKAIDRMKAYVDAGADMIFPEALEGPAEFEAVRNAIDVPLLANMTEFGKSPLLTGAALESLGFNLAIYPVTTMRLAMHAVTAGLAELHAKGTQAGLLDRMQHRRDLYRLLRYEDYNAFDRGIFDFEV
ncbi:MAG: methylisocitrate lyase [Inquilinus sp.]|nr:methylisocitrate lyase [Inquilinus sp.]